ncbi:MAG: AraC family transcriptional regulator [Verrucomicrobia bacterium]|nr:MAG: AraC family transcriptional regulator [Verrucomicrobiota bacterium]TAE86589.1 MAG: AraC family transcriptional regulator [Verrucomicrobiota bacterium]TAF24282.1 MAG: AraC family transcriptional regulator [Verrucomicrobiota bacterium]TAF40336.1 MAG: AraC family transcriptional regulator [Verrucomicrobiota bacterium]
MTAAAKLRKTFSDSLCGMPPVDRLFDAVPDIVFFIKDAAGRYMAVNDTLASRCGLADKELAIGLTAEDLFPSPLGGGFAAQDREILRTGHGIRDHLELHLYPGGRRGWCLTFKEPVMGKEGRRVGVCGISRDLHGPHDRQEDFAAMSKAIDRIHKHFDEPLRLPQLAELADMSVYQFDQRIRALFHVTAGQYLVKVRIDAACERLSHSDEAIAQIALSCGYSDQSAFSRQFKQAVGISPLAYRKKMRA